MMKIYSCFTVRQYAKISPTSTYKFESSAKNAVFEHTEWLFEFVLLFLQKVVSSGVFHIAQML